MNIKRTAADPAGFLQDACLFISAERWRSPGGGESSAHRRRSDSTIPPSQLIDEGFSRETLVDGYLSATSDGLLVGVARNCLSHFGIKDIGSDALVVEFKSIDPRVSLKEAKAEHAGQTQVQMGLIRHCSVYKPNYALISYADASFLDNISEFAVAFDPAVYAAAQKRAQQIMLVEDPATLPPEGKIAGGDECRYCPFKARCQGATVASIPRDTVKIGANAMAHLKALVEQHEQAAGNVLLADWGHKTPYSINGASYPFWIAPMVAGALQAAQSAQMAATASRSAAASLVNMTSAQTFMTLAQGFKVMAEAARDAALVAQVGAEQAVTDAGAIALSFGGRMVANSATETGLFAGIHGFSIAPGKAFVPGQILVAVDRTNPARAMVGSVTSHNQEVGSLVLTVDAGDVSGSGTCSDWLIVLSGKRGPTGAPGPAGGIGPPGPGDGLVYDRVPEGSSLTVGAGQQMFVHGVITVEGRVTLDGTMGAWDG